MYTCGEVLSHKELCKALLYTCGEVLYHEELCKALLHSLPAGAVVSGQEGLERRHLPKKIILTMWTV
jgi:hypothetical protein